MKSSFIKITPLFLAMTLLSLATRAESKVSLYGDAWLTYTTYSAKFDKYSPYSTGNSDEEQSSLSGTSFLQQYSAAMSANNIKNKYQQDYYNVNIGYNWSQFNTKATEDDSTNRYKGSTGNLQINGRVAYAPVELPVKLNLFAYNGRTSTLNSNLFTNDIIGDGLASGATAGGTVAKWGGTLDYEPDRATNVALRGLPSLHIDYLEINIANPDSSKSKTKELAVAGLSKGNNWINYRFIQSEQYRLGTLSGSHEQAVQIGLVDFSKRRKWSALTNWINISADGQLITRNILGTTASTEEYDVNFFAIATRKDWSAMTFLNYNRLTSQESYKPLKTLESFRLPLNVRGKWGRETDWFFRVSTQDSVTKKDGLRESSYSSSSISIGGNTLKSSSFTFSPAFTFNSYKYDTGVAAYDAVLNLETRSNGRFSNKWGVTASSYTKYKDDGSADGVSWNQAFMLNTGYRSDSPFMFSMSENVQLGSGKDFVNLGNQTSTGSTGNIIGDSPANRGNGVADYLRTVTTTSLAWNKSASFYTAFDGSYDLLSSNNTLDAVTDLRHRLSYSKNSSSFRLDSEYLYRNADGNTSSQLYNTGTALYRPDTRNEGMLSYSFSRSASNGNTISGFELKQRYSLKFFSKAGTMRDLGSLTEEFSYKQQNNSTGSYSLSLSGRYSPTSKTSLYSSVLSQSSAGVLTFVYSAGASANFSLLSTSVDYSLAKRDIDHRTEQRIATTIRRTF